MKGKNWRFVEGVTKADVAYEAYGKTAETVFVNAAKALTEVMVESSTVKPRQNFKFTDTNFLLEELLFDFLSELVFLKDAEDVVFSKFDVRIKKIDTKSYLLKANIWGEKIDPKRHKMRLDVKAVTRHQFSLKKEKGGYIARVVLDI